MTTGRLEATSSAYTTGETNKRAVGPHVAQQPNGEGVIPLAPGQGREDDAAVNARHPLHTNHGVPERRRRRHHPSPRAKR